MVLEGFFDWMFGFIVNNMEPRWSLIVISFLITAFITFVYKLATNQQLMKDMKKEIKELQKKMKDLKDQPDKLMQVNQEAMKKNMQYMKHSLRPTFFTLIPILIIFNWLRVRYLPEGFLFVFGFDIPLIGPGFGWLWTYILSSIIFSMLLRRIFKIH